MKLMPIQRVTLSRPGLIRAVVAVALIGGMTSILYAPPMPAASFKSVFQDQKGTAEVVGKGRVLSVVCMKAEKGKEKSRTLTLQLAIQVLSVEKGPVKENQILVVTRQIVMDPPWPPPVYYSEEVASFPSTPGAEGDIALNWNKDTREYEIVAGYVEHPKDTALPETVGEAISAK